MTDMDQLPDDRYEAITGKKRERPRHDLIEEAFEGHRTELGRFISNPAPSRKDLQAAARILRLNGFMVAKRGKGRRA